MFSFIDDFNLIRVESLEEIKSVFIEGYTLKLKSVSNGISFYETMEAIDLHTASTIIINDNKYPLNIGLVTLSEEFERRYQSDLEMGAFIIDGKTTFRFFSPVVKEAYVIVNNNEYKMDYLEPVFQLTIDADLGGYEYYYKIRLVWEFRVVKDPYTKSVMCGKSYIIDESKVTKVKKAKKAYELPLIYEASVHDLTNTLDIKNKGVFLGLLEASTKLGNRCMLEYIKDIGVTHLQLMPIFTFHGIDEVNHDKLYNWGYNPDFYFSLCGFFTNDHANPYAIIEEFIKVVNKAHQIDLRVCMDVVYNHVFGRDIFPYDEFVPGYFYKHDSNNKPTNSSYCGNDVETRRYMVRKYIIDNLLYYERVFGIDGFRIDLMGLIDINTVLTMKDALQKQKKDILLYGEGWNMPSILDETERASIENHDKIPGILMFNDQFRDSLRGDNYSSNAGLLVKQSEVFYEKFIDSFNYLPFDQSINYISCHDNFTIFDRLSNTAGIKTAFLPLYITLGLGLVLLSRGTPFIHSGVEMKRTKGGLDNSYNIPGNTNNIYFNLHNNYIYDKLLEMVKIRNEYNYIINSEEYWVLFSSQKYYQEHGFNKMFYVNEDGNFLEIVFKNDFLVSHYLTTNKLVYSTINVNSYPKDGKIDYIIDRVGILVFVKSGGIYEAD